MEMLEALKMKQRASGGGVLTQRCVDLLFCKPKSKLSFPTSIFGISMAVSFTNLMTKHLSWGSSRWSGAMLVDESVHLNLVTKVAPASQDC